MYLQIHGAELVPDEYGNHIKVTRVWLYDSDGVRTRRVTLNDVVLFELTKGKIDIVDGLFPNPLLDATNWEPTN